MYLFTPWRLCHFSDRYLRFEDSWDDFMVFQVAGRNSGLPGRIRELPKKIAFAGKTWFYPMLVFFMQSVK